MKSQVVMFILGGAPQAQKRAFKNLPALMLSERET